MGHYDHTFWTDGDERLQKIAQRFEEGITLTHPPDAAACWCGEHCPYARSTVKRFEYRGPSL